MHEAKPFPKDRPPDLDAWFGTVGDAMTTSVVTLEPGMRASDAAAFLARTGVAGGPVVEGGHVVGVITLKDLLEPDGHTPQTTGPFLRVDRHLAEVTVRDVMKKEVVTARADWPLTRAVVLMDDAKVNRLPVLDAHGRAVGILARDDVLRAVAKGVRATVTPATYPSVVPTRAPKIPPD